MAQSKYNVDDILREVREKKEKATHLPPAAEERLPEQLLKKTSAGAAAAKSEEKKPKAEPEFLWDLPAEKPAMEPPAEKREQPPVFSAIPIEEPIPETVDSHCEEKTAEAPPTVRPGAPAEKDTVPPKRQAVCRNAADARSICEPILEELERRHRGLTASLVVNLLALAGVVYLILAPVYHLMLPDLLATSTAYRMWGMVALVAISAICCGGTLGNGFLALFPGRTGNDAYVTLTVFACLLQGSFMAAKPELAANYSKNIYLPMAAAILLFHTWGKLAENARRRESCEAAMRWQPAVCRTLPEGRLTAWAGDLSEQAETVISINPVSALSDLEKSLEAPSPAEAIAGVVAPIAFLAAVVMAVGAYYLGGDLFSSACIFTAALCITSPFAASLGSHLPLRSANRGLLRWKTALLGQDAVKALADADAVLLRCSDLFPSDSVMLHGIRTFEKKPVDEAILNAASVLCCVDSTLTGVFRNMIPSQEILKPVESITSEEGMGISAWVDGGRVLIGNRRLLQLHGVPVPLEEVEQKLAADGKELLYLSNFGSLSAGFVISYRADKQMKQQLQALEKNGIALLLHTTDPNVTPARVAQVYGVAEEMIHIVPAAMHGEAEEALAATERLPAAMVSGSAAGSLHSIGGAQRCESLQKTISVLLELSVLIGFALITFLAYAGAVARLTWMAIGAYHLLWLLPILLLGLLRKK